MQKLLFISPELPYPLRSGGKVKSHKLLSMLCEQYEVSLVCPLKLEDGEFVEEFSTTVALERLVCEPIDIPRNGVNLLISYFKRKPLNLYRSFTPVLAKFIEDNHAQFDLMFVDHYEAYQYVPAQFEGSVIYHSHNAYFKMWQRYAETSANPIYRIVTAIEAKRVVDTELSICDAADLVFAAPNDIDELVSRGANRDKFQATYHLGDDEQLSLPALQFDHTEKRLVYVGFLGWEPNAAGLLWFLTESWPLIKAKDPAVQLDVIGKNPDERLQSIALKDDSVHLHGFVEDLEDYFPKSRISIAPLQFGSGMKVKVLSAMARGIPIVTTDVGAEGIAVANGQHMLISNDAQGIASDVIRLLNDETLWTTLRDKSRQLIDEKYTWRALFNAMYQSMEAL